MSTDPREPSTLDEIEQLANQLLHDVSGILDRQQRTFVMAEQLTRLPAETILEIFRIITKGAMRHESKYEDGFRMISDVKKLGKMIGFGKMSEVYTLARRKDYPEVVRLMQNLPPARHLGEDEELEPDPVLADLTLGHKRELARTRNYDLINRLCHDQDPVVIQNLLRNPRVTIKEVVKIASKRPTNAKILWVIYRDLKWNCHYVVKMTLINNPYTPTPISLALLLYLMEQDLVDVAENMILHPAVREAAIDLIKQKRKLGQDSARNQPKPPSDKE